MKKNQNQTIKMFQLTSEYLNESDSTLLNGLPGFQECKNEINLNNTKIRSQYDLQTRKITGFAVEKKSIRNELTEVALDISNRVEAYATNTGDLELKKDIHYTVSFLNKISENELISKCDNIHSTANSLVSDLSTYGVTPAQLTHFKDLINKFNNTISRSQSEINIGKMATSEIVHLINANQQQFEKMDLIIKMLKSTAPELVNGYFESRNINSAAHRPISIRFFLFDNLSKPIPMVLVSNEELKIRRRTGSKGIIYLKNIREGSFEFTFSKIGYTTVKRMVNVIPSERTDIKVVMALD
jgi:hypothetical protein